MPLGRSRSYVQAAVRRAGITAAGLRADRFLDEALASGGDPLRLTHLFGISDPPPSATAPRPTCPDKTTTMKWRGISSGGEER